MVRVGVIGHGRLGKPLVKFLRGHPNAEIVYLHSNSEPSKISLSESGSEFVFFSGDNGTSRQYEHEWEGLRGVIDLSADHRLCDDWPYGLPELNKDKIRKAQRVANPGCYATAVLLPLLPFEGILDDVHIKAYSGVSGRSGQEVDETRGIEKYGGGREHYQVKEIEKTLGRQIVSFEPHIVYPVWTGLVARIEAKLNAADALDRLLYKNPLNNQPFVKFKDLGIPEEIDLAYIKEKTKLTEGTNFCYISYAVKSDSITIVSVLDNLIKGGSGQAVQNFNLMYGFDETEGLLQLYD